MGRKNWKESVSQKGPGRKSKKQGDPKLPPQLHEQGKGVKRTKAAADLGGRIKQRARKRAVKSATTKALRQGAKRVKSKDGDADYRSVPPPLTEEASLPPTKKKKKQVKINLFHEGSDGSSGK